MSGTLVLVARPALGADRVDALLIDAQRTLDAFDAGGSAALREAMRESLREAVRELRALGCEVALRRGMALAVRPVPEFRPGDGEGALVDPLDVLLGASGVNHNQRGSR